MKKIFLSIALLFTSMSVLASDWIPASDGEIPGGAIRGGNNERGDAIYICRATPTFKHGRYVGFIAPGENACIIAVDAFSKKVSKYEVLVLDDRALQRQSSYTPARKKRSDYEGVSGEIEQHMQDVRNEINSHFHF